MKDRRRRDLASRGGFFFCTFAVVLFCSLFSALTFSAFRLFGVSFRPILLPSWRNSGAALYAAAGIGAGGGDPTLEHSGRRRVFTLRPFRTATQDAVVFPDQVLVSITYPPRSTSLPTSPHLLHCDFYGRRDDHLRLPPVSSELGLEPHTEIVRCPLPPSHGDHTGVSVRGDLPPVSFRQSWHSVAYKAFIDGGHGNTTVVFVKGLNLRPEKLAEPRRFECVYGHSFTRGHRFRRGPAISVAQEIVRCRTPVVLLKQPQLFRSLKVSVNVKGRGIFDSAARLTGVLAPAAGGKRFTMCVCTMLRNQARFLKEWIVYHGRIGVEKWFIYDNNSNDDLESVIELLRGDGYGYKISRHVWPWIKTQEAGFAHCALLARDSCEWVGFIDVDEFLHLPSSHTLPNILRNYSDSSPWVGELRTSCLTFGPSGLDRAPVEGVMAGYTCRMVAPERHKSIVRPLALNSTLVNVVHHFHLRQGFDYVNMDRGAMVINHYKYQAWEVFKEKFYRRVATYVADWQENENEGSKDRAPGLGTRAIQPPDWPSRFCEVTDTGLRDWVLQEFMDPLAQLLPWQQNATYSLR